MQAGSLGPVLAQLVLAQRVLEMVQTFVPEPALTQTASARAILEQERIALPGPVLA